MGGAESNVKTVSIALRESLGVNGAKEWMNVDGWSDWILAITPENPPEKLLPKKAQRLFDQPRSEGMPGFTMKKEKLLQKFETEAKGRSGTGIACGIYEWAIKKSALRRTICSVHWKYM